MALPFDLYPASDGFQLKPHTLVGSLNLSIEVKDLLQRLGITRLKELAQTSPARLQWESKGQIPMPPLAAVLEEFFVSLDRDELLRDYSLWVEVWEPLLSDAENIRQLKLSLWLPDASARRLFPRDNEPAPPGLRMPVANLGVSVRAMNCLKTCGIANVHELALTSPRLLLRVRNLGITTLSEFAAIVEEYFISLEPSLRTPYEESYPLWIPLFVGRAPLPERVNRWLSKPDAGPVPEESPPDPAIYGSPPRPPGLDVPIPYLELPARVVTYMERWGVKNLHELALIEPLRFLKAGNVGRKSLLGVAKVLNEYFKSLAKFGHWKVYDCSCEAWKPYLSCLPNPGSPEPGVAEPPLPVNEIFSTFLSQQDGRNRDILVKRFALLAGSSPQTLLTIGRSSGLTRERVRQITANLQKRIAATVCRHHPGLFAQLGARVDQAVVATMDEILSLIPISGESHELSLRSCVETLLRTIPGMHSIDPAAQLWTSTPSIDRHFYHNAIMASIGVRRAMGTDLPNLGLETARKLGCSGQEADAVRVIIQNTPSIAAVRPFKQIVITRNVGGAKLRPIETSGKLRGVVAQRQAFAHNYLRKQGVPATLAEIFDAMEALEPAIVPHHRRRFFAIHTLRTVLENDNRFAWAGVCAFGLRDWGYEPDVTSIRQALVALLRKRGPLTLPEIQEALGKLFRIDSSSAAMALSAENGNTVIGNSHGRWQALL